MSAQIQTLHHNKDDAECWQNILTLSRAMQENARQGKWEEVIKSESERQGMIGSYFSKHSSPNEMQNLASDIQAILNIDREIMELGKHNKDELSSEIHNLQTGRKASQVYTKHNA